MGQKIEGYWDCAVCGKKANKGRYRNCPSCGRPRGKTTKFYLIEKDKFVSDDVVPKGPDWFCECCDSYNTFSADYCTSCGAPKGASKNYFEMQKKESESKTAEESSSSTTYHKEYSHSYPKRFYRDDDYTSSKPSHSYTPVKSEPINYSKPIKKSGKSAWGTIVDFVDSYKVSFLVILLILAMVGAGIYLIIPKNVTLHVTQISWERSIDIQEYKTVRENDWYIPAGGRLVYSQSEIRRYEQVLDHYETRYETRYETYISGYTSHTNYIDLGNGYYDTETVDVPEYSTRSYTEPVEYPVYRSEPVYDTKYYYDIERWVYTRTSRSSGIDKNPYWPKTNLSTNERESTKHQNYVVTGYNVKDEKQKSRSYSINYDLWQQVNPSTDIECMVSVGRITEIKNASTLYEASE